MGGGSYNHLYTKDAYPDIFSCKDPIQKMGDRLIELGYVKAGQDTLSILKDIEEFQAQLQDRLYKLSKVWKAVEWHDSGDLELDSLKDRMNKYRE